jgi:hypothetical protein
VSDDVINSVLIDKLGVWMKREYEKCSKKNIILSYVDHFYYKLLSS